MPPIIISEKSDKRITPPKRIVSTAYRMPDHSSDDSDGSTSHQYNPAYILYCNDDAFQPIDALLNSRNSQYCSCEHRSLH